MRASISMFRPVMIGLGLCAGLAAWSAGAFGEGRTSPSEKEAAGSFLFHHNWRPHDPQSHAGDGLGPVFNATSCVACHGLGGSGGAGSAKVNVQIVTPIINSTAASINLGELSSQVKIQTGLAASGSAVLHRFGTSPQYALWRKKLIKTDTVLFTLRQSERNTPALFGAGLIDAVPVALIEEAARRDFPEFPEIGGRVSRLRDGRIGRFGWKGHTASLKDFVLTACSVELGLEVPDHHQSIDPSARGGKTFGLDLSADECSALVQFVGNLPPPDQRVATTQAELSTVVAGENLFQFIGCATCHAPRIGALDGMYSDLLLHDMGRSLSDSAAYYGTDLEIQSPPPNIAGASGRPKHAGLVTVEHPGPQGNEWRTPPLWGVRDSAPYLHDGRASTLDEAIRRHGGEAAPAANRYANLLFAEKEQLLMFLLSLAAPGRAQLDPVHALRIRQEIGPVEIGASRLPTTSTGFGGLGSGPPAAISGVTSSLGTGFR